MTIFNSFLYVFQRVLGDLMHWHAMDMFRPTHEIMSSQHGVRYVGSTWFNQMELSFGHFGGIIGAHVCKVSRCTLPSISQFSLQIGGWRLVLLQVTLEPGHGQLPTLIHLQMVFPMKQAV